MTVKELAELIKEEWSASMSDSGAIWQKAYDRLQAALRSVDEDTKAAAYKQAYLDSRR